MKKRIYSMILILMTGLCAGCGKEGVKNNNTGIESESSQVEDSVSFENTEDSKYVIIRICQQLYFSDTLFS